MQTDPEVQFFDEFSEKYGDYDVLGEKTYSLILDVLQQRCGFPPKGATIADMGCGTGAFTRRMAARFDSCEVIGVDISPKQIDLAQKMVGEGKAVGRYIVGDITSTNFESNSVDLITYSGVLHHFSERSMRVKVLTEGARILKPGGSMFSYDPNLHSPSMWLYRHPNSPLCSKEGKTENEVLLSREQMEEEVREAGLSRIDTRALSGIYFCFVEGSFARKVLPLYNLYEWLIHVSLLESRLGTFVVMSAQKSP